MRIDIKGSGFPITTALMDHTERRLRFALTVPRSYGSAAHC